MQEAPCRVERLPEPFGATHGAAAANVAAGRSASRISGWSVSLVTPAAVTPGVDWLLSFRNYYAASVRVDLVLCDGQTVTVVDGLPLMRRLHCEDDAQNWHVVKLELPFLEGSKTTGRTLAGVRVYCQQQSPLWAKWELHNLKIFRHEKDVAEPPGETAKGPDARSVASRHALIGNASEHAADDPIRSGQSSTGAVEGSSEQPVIASVDAQAARCLDLVLRLRQLLATPVASSV